MSGDGSDGGDDSIDDFLRRVARVGSAEAPLPIVPFDLLSGPPTLDARRRLRIAGPEALPVVDPTAYEILGEIARGGMGRILLAFDRRLGRRVAVKELLPGAGASAAERLVREALVTARLDHPGVVPLYEAGRWPSGVPFFAMKLVAGRSLAALITAAGSDRVARRALVRHLPAACATVAYANARGVVHRDLKPGNLLVGDLGEVVVIDWGLARLADAEIEASLPPAWSGSSIVGTPGYQAPEQEAGAPVDGRADVYSLGVTLRAIVGEARDFAAIVERATAKAPSARYADAAALGAAIAAALGDGGAATAGRTDAATGTATGAGEGARVFALTGEPGDSVTDLEPIAPAPVAAAADSSPPTVNEKRRPPPRGAEAARATEGSASRSPERRGRGRVGLLVGGAALAAGLAGWALGRGGGVGADARPPAGAPIVAATAPSTGRDALARQKIATARAALERDATEAVRRVKALPLEELPDALRAEAQALVEEAARRGVARAEVRITDAATATAAAPIALATDGTAYTAARVAADGGLELIVGGVAPARGAEAAPGARVAVPLPPGVRASTVALSLDGKRAAVLGADGRGATFAIDERPPRLVAPLACPAAAVTLSMDGALALCRGGGRARAVDTTRGAPVVELPAEVAGLSLDGALVVAAPPPRPHRGAPPIVVAPAALLATAGHAAALALAPRAASAAGAVVAALAPDGRLLVGAGDAPVRTLARALGGVDALAFTQDGAWVVAARADGVHLAALSDGHALALAPVGGAHLAAVATSPDGDTLALLDTTGRLRLYALDTLGAPSTHAVADARAFRLWLEQLTALGPLHD